MSKRATKMVAYLRCSTDKQDDSLETQRAQIESFASKHDIMLVKVYSETVSGAHMDKRPVFKHMLSELKDLGVEGVIVQRLDRLFRNSLEQQGFMIWAKKHGVKLTSITESLPDDIHGEMMAKLLGVFAEYERTLTGVRIREHNRHLAELGIYPGGRAPYGYAYDEHTKRLVRDEQNAWKIIEVFQSFVAHGGRVLQTADSLNARGILTPHGRLWHGENIRWIISRPIYRGKTGYAGEEFNASMAPEVVPVSLANQAYEMLCSRRTGPREARPTKAFTYKGLLQCSVCGKRLTSNRRTGTADMPVEWYRCIHRPSIGPKRTITSKVLDRWIGYAVRRVLVRHWAEIRTKAREIGAKGGSASYDVQREIKRLEDRRHNIEMAVMEGIITPARAKCLIDAVITKLDDLSRRRPPQNIPNEEALEKMIKSWFHSWYNLSPATRRDVLIGTIDSIRVSPTYNTDGLIVVSPHIDQSIRVGGRLNIPKPRQ